VIFCRIYGMIPCPPGTLADRPALPDCLEDLLEPWS
jgi:hypothetical protein